MKGPLTYRLSMIFWQEVYDFHVLKTSNKVVPDKTSSSASSSAIFELTPNPSRP